MQKKFNSLAAPSFVTEPNILSKIINSTEQCVEEIEHLSGILAYKTLAHEILYCNKSFLSYCGHKKMEQLEGKTDYDLIWQDYTEIYHGQEDDALKSECYIAIHPGVDSQGRNFLFLNRKYPWFDLNGRPKGIISYSIEITEKNFIDLGAKLKASAKHNEEGIHYLNKKLPDEQLTRRESECMFYLVRGKTSKCIGKILGISHRTVETYIEHLKEKLNCHSRCDLIEQAIKMGFAKTIPQSLFSPQLGKSLIEP